MVLPAEGYREAVRELCTKYGSYMIIDETHTLSNGYGGYTRAHGLKPDFVTFSEVRNYNKTNFTARVCASLKEKGLSYYSFYSYDTGLLSKHPITDSLTVFPEKDDHGSIYRLTSSVNGHKVAVYTSHLDYLDCAYYNVRGYDCSTWK